MRHTKAILLRRDRDASFHLDCKIVAQQESCGSGKSFKTKTKKGVEKMKREA
jgi:hypothetical protein